MILGLRSSIKQQRDALLKCSRILKNLDPNNLSSNKNARYELESILKNVKQTPRVNKLREILIEIWAKQYEYEFNCLKYNQLQGPEKNIHQAPDKKLLDQFLDASIKSSLSLIEEINSELKLPSPLPLHTTQHEETDFIHSTSNKKLGPR